MMSEPAYSPDPGRVETDAVPRHILATRLFHAGLALAIITQLVSSLVMEPAEDGEPGNLWFTLHEYSGLPRWRSCSDSGSRWSAAGAGRPSGCSSRGSRARGSRTSGPIFARIFRRSGICDCLPTMRTRRFRRRFTVSASC